MWPLVQCSEWGYDLCIATQRSIIERLKTTQYSSSYYTAGDYSSLATKFHLTQEILWCISTKLTAFAWSIFLSTVSKFTVLMHLLHCTHSKQRLCWYAVLETMQVCTMYICNDAEDDMVKRLTLLGREVDGHRNMSRFARHSNDPGHHWHLLTPLLMQLEQLCNTIPQQHMIIKQNNLFQYCSSHQNNTHHEPCVYGAVRESNGHVQSGIIDSSLRGLKRHSGIHIVCWRQWEETERESR